MSAAHATDAERVAALQVAAKVLQERWPKVQAECLVCIGPNTLAAYAVMHWPGVIRVTVHGTGELLAESLPGLPFIAASRPAGADLLQGLAAHFGATDDLRLVADVLASPELATLRGAELCAAMHGLAERLDDLL